MARDTTSWEGMSAGARSSSSGYKIPASVKNNQGPRLFRDHGVAGALMPYNSFQRVEWRDNVTIPWRLSPPKSSIDCELAPPLEPSDKSHLITHHPGDPPADGPQGLHILLGRSVLEFLTPLGIRVPTGILPFYDSALRASPYLSPRLRVLGYTCTAVMQTGCGDHLLEDTLYPGSRKRETLATLATAPGASGDSFSGFSFSDLLPLVLQHPRHFYLTLKEGALFSSSFTSKR